ncbi:hypothetical protein VaNZ11_014205 [Volvox africanus]|uniref:Uncharacterized protein n=1 Tax=Volvox africanus TaxID=51714 RepID=A0ABQ5SIH8_9CHLO|nr:hypothetical protein VaNZ11_014205 [Volvox africanus]
MEAVVVKTLAQIAPEDVEHPPYCSRSLCWRAVVAKSLGIPAHVLGSSLRQQTLNRIHQARGISRRAAIYRSVLRASAASALTASATHDIPQLVDLTVCSQRPRANSRTAINATSDGDNLGSNSCSGCRNEPAVANIRVPAAPASAAACCNGHTVTGAQHGNGGDQRAWSFETAASATASPYSVHTSVGLDEAAASNLRGMLRPSGSAPAYILDLILRPEAWERLWEATDAAISAYARARAQDDDTRHVLSGRGGFSAKLHQNTMLELRLETDAALEELREAVWDFPVHRLAWRLAQEAGPSWPAHRLDGAHGLAVESQSMERKSTSEQDKWKPGDSVSQTELHHRAVNLVVAHAVLSRPYPISAGACGRSSQMHDPSTAAAVTHERLRGHHQQCAALTTDSLLASVGRPIVTFPELAAVASALAEVWALPKECLRSAGMSTAASPCGKQMDLVLQLVRWCTVALAIDARKRTRSLGMPGRPLGNNLDRRTGAVARGHTTTSLPAAVSSSSSSSGGDAVTPTSPGSPDGQTSQRSPDTPKHQLREREANGVLPDGAVWTIGDLAGRAVHAHITAVAAAVEQCKRKGAVSTTGTSKASTWAAYEDAVQHACAAEAAPHSGQPRTGDGGHVTSAGDLLRTVLLGVPQLVHRKGPWRDRDGFDGPYGGFPAADRGLGDRGLVVGLEHGRALGLSLLRGDDHGSRSGSGSDRAVVDHLQMIAAAKAEVALLRMELVEVVLESALTGRPRKLTATGPAALRGVLAAVSAVSRISQASLPHPAAVAACPSPPHADGPIFLRFDLAPVRSDPIGGSCSSSDAPVQAAGNQEAGRREPDTGLTVQRVDHCLRPELFSVTLVPRSAAVGKAVRRLLGYAKAQAKSSGFMLTVPSAAFVTPCAESNGSGACSWGSGARTHGRRDSGDDLGHGAAHWAERKQLLNRTLDAYRCAWLQCPDLEALQAATLLIAEVSHELKQDWDGDGRWGSKAPTCGPSGSESAGPHSLFPGLEVLPFLGHCCGDQLIREAGGRIMRDLLTAAGPPLEAAQGLSGAGASTAHGLEHEPSWQKQAGRAGCTKGVLENGWQAVRRLALNREACFLLGVTGKSLQGRSRGNCDATGDVEDRFSTSLSGGASLAPWSDDDTALSLLVLRQQDLERDAGDALSRM